AAERLRPEVDEAVDRLDELDRRRSSDRERGAARDRPAASVRHLHLPGRLQRLELLDAELAPDDVDPLVEVVREVRELPEALPEPEPRAPPGPLWPRQRRHLRPLMSSAEPTLMRTAPPG